MNLLRRLGHFATDNWLTLAIITAIFLLSFVLLMIPSQKYVRAPVESCSAALTGNVKVEDIPVQSCAGYDKNMVCTVPITTYVQQHYDEARVTCDFNEWRAR